MKLQAPFIQLPMRFDASMLANEIGAMDESSWKPHPENFAGNSMLPLVAVNGDPDNEAFAGPMRRTPHLEACPYLCQVIASLGATAGRTRLMRLSGQAEVKRHIDQGYYWAERVRVHVPIVTQPTVRFECGDAAIHMAEGECWIFDTWRQHRVLNDADAARVHLVVDTVGGAKFWELVGRGSAHGVPPTPWQPELIAWEPSAEQEFPLESVNVPTVMSPWELNAHLGLLFSEAVPHPQLGQVQLLAAQLIRGWRGLWAQHGDSWEGRPHFRVMIDRFATQVQAPAQAIQLRNGGDWYSTLITLVVLSALEGAKAPSSEYGIADRG